MAACIAASLAGCSSGQGQLDEEKEPHFVLGKSRVNAMDYEGAVEAFNESLEVNPRSGAAHFQLAWLYDNKENDPAAAIYHYQEFLKLNPQAPNASAIQGRVESCKQQLAADVLQLPSAPAAQKQIEDLAEKNRQLQQQVDRLNDALKQWNAWYASQQAATKTGSPPPNNPISQPTSSPTPDDISALPIGGTTTARSTPPPPKPAKTPRTHTVAAGDTPASIARKYSVKLEALLAANPGLEPKHLRVGQAINVPAP